MTSTPTQVYLRNLASQKEFGVIKFQRRQTGNLSHASPGGKRAGMLQPQLVKPVMCQC